MTTAEPVKKKRRPLMWVILVINALFLIWVIAGVNSGGSSDCKSLDAATCQAAQQVGTGIGVLIIFFLWAVVDVVLLVLWLVTRPRQQQVVYVQQPPSV